MRLIGSLPNEHQAHLFTAWLIAEGIDAKFEPEVNSFEIWVKSEDLVGRACGELTAFVENPTDAKYQDALQRAAEVQKSRVDRRRQIEKNLVSPQSNWRTGRRGPLTIVLIIASCAVALMTNFGHPSYYSGPTVRALAFTAISAPQSEDLLRKYNGDTSEWAIKFANIRQWELWRLITPIFIHFNQIHLIFNMIWLFQLGRLIETRYGSGALAALVVATAAISNFAQMAAPSDLGGVTPAEGPGLIVALLGGMSGVVYGLFGFVWVKAVVDPASRFQISQITVVLMIAWLFVCMTPMGGQMFGSQGEIGVGRSSIANWAHAVGLFVGMAAGYLATITARKPTT